MNRSDPRPARYRPGPLRWFWYAVGGRLPARYRSWVLHDLTAAPGRCVTWPGWWLNSPRSPSSWCSCYRGPCGSESWVPLEDHWSGCSTPSSSSTKRPRDGQPTPATPTARCTRSGTSARPSAPSGEPPPTSTAPGTTSDTTCGPGTDFYIEMPSPRTRTQTQTRRHHAGHVVSRPRGSPRSRSAASVHRAAAG
jgi:Family of unknown function (DUF5313)